MENRLHAVQDRHLQQIAAMAQQILDAVHIQSTLIGLESTPSLPVAPPAAAPKMGFDLKPLCTCGHARVVHRGPEHSCEAVACACEHYAPPAAEAVDNAAFVGHLRMRLREEELRTSLWEERQSQCAGAPDAAPPPATAPTTPGGLTPLCCCGHQHVMHNGMAGRCTNLECRCADYIPASAAVPGTILGSAVDPWCTCGHARVVHHDAAHSCQIRGCTCVSYRAGLPVPVEPVPTADDPLARERVSRGTLQGLLDRIEEALERGEQLAAQAALIDLRRAIDMLAI